MMRSFSVVLALFVALPGGVSAFERIIDRDDFVGVVDKRDLRIPIYGLTLNVSADGTISGRAVGNNVTGTWSWENGYFCREMDWSGYAIGYNCQLVELNGDRIRFTVNRGTGNSAVLRIR